MKKRGKIVLCFLVLFILAIASIWIGIYFNHLSSPKNIMNQTIDGVGARLQLFLQDSTSHYLGDTFHLESKIQFQLDSEKLMKDKEHDAESLKKYRMMQNLSKMQSTLTVMQDGDKKQALLSLQQVLGNEEVLNAKYVIDNSTRYYFVNRVLKNYVNDGNCSYFETLNSDNTSLDNIYYLYSFIENSLKEQLKDEYFQVYRVEENIGEERKTVKQVSLKLTDKVIRNILKGVLKDLKADEKACKILTGIDDHFSKRKISNKTTFLDSDESYTIHIYTSTVFCKPLKYEVVHLKGDTKSSVSYEGNDVQGDLYWIENDQVQKRLAIHFQDRKFDFLIYNSKDQKIGSFEYDRDQNGVSFDFHYDDSIQKYNFIYSSKYENVRKNSFINHQKLSMKVVHDKVGLLDGVITVDTEGSRNAKMMEDVSNAVLASTLSEEQKNSFNHVSLSVLERLKK